MRRLRTQYASVWAFILLFAIVLVPTTATGQNDGKATVKVMTYNVNEGTDFLEVLSATNPIDFLKAVQITLNNIDSTNPPLRMQAVAKEIAQTQPDLVGLQEVTTWSVGGQVRYDMLDELISALHGLGENYSAIVIADEFQLEAPMPNGVMVKGVNHDVILARDASEMELSNPQKRYFSVILPVPIPVAPFVIFVQRGWGSVDVKLDGQSFRFVVSHLEQVPPSPPADPNVQAQILLLQEGQALELVTDPAGINSPVIIAVDANADALGGDPTIATYQLIRSFGFGDTWAAVHPDQPGATWGFMNDANDPRPPVRQRIDYIFFKNGVRALTAQLAGQRPQDKVDGLWPSDHIGVRANLLLGWD
jgi:endonuclease/exonuclease/phosphatase family metal-dependent hydrolase